MQTQSTKRVFQLTAALLTATILTAPFAAFAADAAKDSASQKTATTSKYPLKTCVVSDEKLGEMGDPFVFKYEGKEVQLCCKSCKKDFDKNPKKFIKKLTNAEKKANKNKNKS